MIEQICVALIVLPKQSLLVVDRAVVLISMWQFRRGPRL